MCEYRFKDNTAIYNGRMRAHMFEGHGKIKYREGGDMYIGYWKEGKFHGSGRYLHGKGSV